VTGDLDVDSTIAAAALTIGALPARLAPEPGPAGPLRLPGLPFRKTEYIPRPDQAAVLRVAWPAAGAGEIPVGAALQLAIDALVDRLRIQLREDLGATYSPRGTLYQAPDDPAFAFAWIELTFDPRRAEGLGARALALADDLATQGVSEEEFARLREPRRAQTAAQLASDFWWVQRILVRAQSEPRVLLEARTLGAAYAALTRDDVNRAAARFLHSSQASAILVMPASGSPAP
jgi:zinc protease